MLKPGGTYYFLEHVTATDPVLHFWQTVFSPVFRIVGNGCEFRELWSNIDSFNPASGIIMKKLYALDV